MILTVSKILITDSKITNDCHIYTSFKEEVSDNGLSYLYTWIMKSLHCLVRSNFTVLKIL